jgi:hypothetical protein
MNVETLSLSDSLAHITDEQLADDFPQRLLGDILSRIPAISTLLPSLREDLAVALEGYQGEQAKLVAEMAAETPKGNTALLSELAATLDELGKREIEASAPYTTEADAVMRNARVLALQSRRFELRNAIAQSGDNSKTSLSLKTIENKIDSVAPVIEAVDECLKLTKLFQNASRCSSRDFILKVLFPFLDQKKVIAIFDESIRNLQGLKNAAEIYAKSGEAVGHLSTMRMFGENLERWLIDTANENARAEKLKKLMEMKKVGTPLARHAALAVTTLTVFLHDLKNHSDNTSKPHPVISRPVLAITKLLEKHGYSGSFLHSAREVDQQASDREAVALGVLSELRHTFVNNLTMAAQVMGELHNYKILFRDLRIAIDHATEHATEDLRHVIISPDEAERVEGAYDAYVGPVMRSAKIIDFNPLSRGPRVA